MHKVQMHAGAISKLLYGFASVREDNPRAKSRALSSHTDAKKHTVTYSCYCLNPLLQRDAF